MTDRQFKVAWENAPRIKGENPNQFRLCYICERIMNHGTKWNSDINPVDGWNVDHLDGNNKNNSDDNLTSVHYDCNVKKENKNYTNQYKNAKNRLD